MHHQVLRAARLGLGLALLVGACGSELQGSADAGAPDAAGDVASDTATAPDVAEDDTVPPADTTPTDVPHPEDIDAVDAADAADTTAPSPDAADAADATADTAPTDTLAPVDTALPPAAAPVPGDLVITEVMIDPVGIPDVYGEWFELTSLSATDLELAGCTLGNGVDPPTTLTPAAPGPLPTGGPNPTRLAAGARVVLGASRDPARNGGAPVTIAYAGLLLPNHGGALTLACGGAEIDRIDYDAERWVLLPGVALGLSADAPQTAAANDDPTRWCEATAPYGPGAANLGTPGAPNPACPLRDGVVDRCTLIAPTVADAYEDEPTAILGRIFEAGATDATPGVDFSYFLRAQAGVGPVGSDPASDPAWSWHDALPTVGWDDTAAAPGEDQYEAELVGLAVGAYDVALRFSLDGGETWTACDTVPADGTYQAADAGHLSVLDSPCVPNPCDAPGAPLCDGDTRVVPGAPGACTHDGGPAVCAYPEARTDCATLGGRCQAGACVDTARVPVATDLVVTEIMKNPRVIADATGEWVELTNVSGASLDLAGCALRDNGTDSFTVPPSPPFIVTAGARVVFGKSTDLTASGGVPVDLAYGDGFDLNNASDVVTFACAGAVIDTVSYATSGWPNVTGASLNLDPNKTTAAANDLGSAWCVGALPYPDAAGSELGTPGAPNHACPEPVDRCRLVAPADLDLLDNESFVATGQVTEAGLTTTTSGVDPSPLVLGQAGFGPRHTVPAAAPAWTWFDAAPDPAWSDDDAPDSDQYRATLTAPADAGDYDVAFRFSVDGGITWTACDRATGTPGEDGSQNGYQTDHAGVLHVTLASACNPNPCVVPPAGQCQGDLLQTFADVGLCALVGADLDTAACTFAATTVDCAELGGSCADGHCDGTARAPLAGELVFTEIMRHPAAVADFFGEWLEIENTGPVTLNLAGCTVRDDDTDVHLIAPATGALLVASGARVVLGKRLDAASNGGVAVDYAWGPDITLGNGDDELVLSCDGVEVDRVAWGSAGAPFPATAGAAMQLDPGTTDAAANDLGAAWCDALDAYGDGDLGTPGALNPPCADSP